MPLAVPAYSGAISIGTLQMGATMSSAKKKASDRHTAATVLLTSSGLPEADQFALRTVKAARFRPPGHLKAAASATSGNLVFKWHTVPATNTLVGPAGGL